MHATPTGDLQSSLMTLESMLHRTR